MASVLLYYLIGKCLSWLSISGTHREVAIFFTSWFALTRNTHLFTLLEIRVIENRLCTTFCTEHEIHDNSSEDKIVELRDDEMNKNIIYIMYTTSRIPTYTRLFCVICYFIARFIVTHGWITSMYRIVERQKWSLPSMIVITLRQLPGLRFNIMSTLCLFLVMQASKSSSFFLRHRVQRNIFFAQAFAAHSSLNNNYWYIKYNKLLLYYIITSDTCRSNVCFSREQPRARKLLQVQFKNFTI